MATQNDPLPLSREIMVFALTSVKARVALFMSAKMSSRSQLVALRLGQCVSVGNAAERPGTGKRERRDCTGGF